MFRVSTSFGPTGLQKCTIMHRASVLSKRQIWKKLQPFGLEKKSNQISKKSFLKLLKDYSRFTINFASFRIAILRVIRRNFYLVPSLKIGFLSLCPFRAFVMVNFPWIIKVAWSVKTMVLSQRTTQTLERVWVDTCQQLPRVDGTCHSYWRTSPKQYSYPGLTAEMGLAWNNSWPNRSLCW